MGSEPTEIWADGTKIWRNEKGQTHREDGPAVIRSNGSQYWYIHGKLHHLYGPAFVRSDGHFEWCIHDNDVTKQIQKWAKERDIDLNNLTDEDKMIIMIEWGNYGK